MKEDKRTKNLTLRDIHVGDWVQVWSEQKERYSPPLKITQICDDGTIYLVASDEERWAPWKEDIKNVDALPITPEWLREFGFELEHDSALNDKVIFNGKIVSLIRKPNKKIKAYHWIDYFYMHEYIAFAESILGIQVQWKGDEK